MERSPHAVTPAGLAETTSDEVRAEIARDLAGPVKAVRQHETIIRKVRYGLTWGAAAAALAAAVQVIDPSLLVFLGPWAPLGAVAVQGAVSFFAHSAPQDFPRSAPQDFPRSAPQDSQTTFPAAKPAEHSPSTPPTTSATMSSKQGIKETKEAITGVVEVVEAAREVGRDGYQVTDAGVLITDRKLQDAIKAAIDGAGAIPGELADLDFVEGLDLSEHMVASLRKLVYTQHDEL